MKDCSVEWVQPGSFFVALLCILSFLVYSVSASGSYMNALRSRRTHGGLFGSKNQELSPIASNGAPIPPITGKTDLEELDEMYSKCNGIDIRELTIMQFQELFATGQLTSVALTNCYIERIHHMNRVLKTVIEINPDAISLAMKADFERNRVKRGHFGLMHGIPILLKENIATKDLMETTAGSLALAGIRPERDADVVRTLRKSGAVILGKANLSEFAYFRGTNIPSGWSGKGGQNRNAYNLNITPEGSSSGSAVSVSANLAAASVGTETDGSLIAPASIAGICTIKPTLGMPSVRGVIPISHNQDNVGPMGRTVMDIAILLDAMLPEGHYLNSLLSKGSRTSKFRIGVLRHPFWNTSAINSTNLDFEVPRLEDMLHLMQNSLEFEVVDPIDYSVELITNISATKELLVLQHDFKHDINEYLRNEVISPYPIPSPTRSLSYNKYFKNIPLRRIECLKDIIQFNIDNPVPEGYNQELLVMSEATDGLQNTTYIEARDSNRRAARDLLDSVLMQHKLDAVVTPSDSRYEAIIDPNLQDSPIIGYSVAAIAGYPSVNIPAGIGLDGVPFGITFIGMPYTEATLLQIAHAAEQLDPKRQRPRFLS